MAPTATPLPPVAVLSYYPANGLTDQTRQLSLAIALAELLGRRLVLPPVLHHEDALSTNAARLVPELIATRPRMRSLIEINTSSGLLDAADMPTVASLPRCAVANGTIDRVAARPPICEEDRSCTSCVHWVEPPDMWQSISGTIHALHRMVHVPWLHFESMLDVLSNRRAIKKRYPLPLWEQSMKPAPCTLRYRADVLAAARSLLSRVLPEHGR